MSTPLKDLLFQPDFFNDLVTEIKAVYPAFDGDGYLSTVYDEKWESLELKGRMIQGARALYDFLPSNYDDALAILMPVSEKFTGFDAIMFCQYVEEFGLDHFEASMHALEITTVDASAEGAIRPFIIRYPERAMQQMLAWTQHENEHVRRLASEGCRPLLPWNMRLNLFVDDPAPIVPILEALKSDDSLYVRKSVANNLNDISKNQPDLVLDIAERWYGDNEDTNWIVKHALRTLLKKGNQRALAIFGFGDVSDVTISNLTVTPDPIAIGDDLHFSFDLLLQADQPKKLRLEYAIHYLKANGKHSKKVFQISEREVTPNKPHKLTSKQSFRNMSTRKHYPGPHKIDIHVNGIAKAHAEFMVTD
ncbi:MAG: DNA alkylation repair protein [Anaerolineaceae bacterium]|nr:DNA alkylation repair protein [Anaerolineaceae bacterium]